MIDKTIGNSAATSSSYAVLKTPAPGEFRVPERLGGATRAADPPLKVSDLATRTLAAAGEWGDLYARVDVIETAEGPMVMELIEPSLFFGHADEAPRRFAEGIEGALEEA